MLPNHILVSELILDIFISSSGYDFRFVSKQFYKARERAIRNETKLFFIITRNILMKQKYAELIKYKNLKYLSDMFKFRSTIRSLIYVTLIV